MPDAVQRFHERRDSTDHVPVAGDSPEDYMSPIVRLLFTCGTTRVSLPLFASRLPSVGRSIGRRETFVYLTYLPTCCHPRCAPPRIICLKGLPGVDRGFHAPGPPSQVQHADVRLDRVGAAARCHRRQHRPLPQGALRAGRLQPTGLLEDARAMQARARVSCQ